MPALEEKYRKQLKSLSSDLLVVFAARVAASALPFLNGDQGEFLQCWEAKYRAEHLFSVIQALNVAYFRSVCHAKKRNIAVDVAVDAVQAIFRANNNNADADMVDDAVDTAYAIVHAAYAAIYIDTRMAVRSVAYATAIQKRGAASWEIVIFNEMNYLKTEVSVVDYLAKPLSKPCRRIIGGKQANMDAVYRNFLNELRRFGEGFEWWADWYQDRLLGKPIDIELLEKTALLDESLVSQGPAVVNAYLKLLTTGEADRPLNQARVIFIGDGYAGKTSLIRALHGEEVISGCEKMTPGIDIREWPVPNNDIKAHLWDFGGQVMAHAMHKFFLREQCVYIVVLDGRATNSPSLQAEYWLEHVRAFGGHSPVLLVGNKADDISINLEMNSLQERYENIVGFFPISCTHYQISDKHAAQFASFRCELTEQLLKIGTHQIMLTRRHFAVMQTLRERAKQESFLAKQDYEALCNQHQVEVSVGLDRAWLLDLLDKLGMVVHFPKIPTLDEYVLNPRWLTYGVYTLLYSTDAINGNGRLHKNQAVAILKAAQVQDELGNTLSYTAEKSGFVLEAMEQFEIVYRLPTDMSVFILPDLLPADRPQDLFFDKATALAFDFDFEGFLPRHLMTVLIVRKHTEIFNDVVWQNGLRLEAKGFNAQALIQADYHHRRISLWVSGADAARYFSSLYNDFKNLLSPMPKLVYREWVILPVHSLSTVNERLRADFGDLLAMERSGASEYICKYGTFKLNEVLKIMPKEERKEQSRTNNFHGPVTYTENGDIRGVTYGNKNVFPPEVATLNKKLGNFKYDIDLDVADEALKQRALKELEMIRTALATIEKGTPEQRESALETLSRFGDKAKEGTSGTIEALKSIKEGGEAVTWLMQTVPLVVTALMTWVG